MGNRNSSKFQKFIYRNLSFTNVRS
jgi:hypothetical protein